jgi:DNA (cytosine-5)-methyltransferase 1
MGLTLNDFFCGAGGMGLGFQQAGFTIVGAWDFDKYAVESYRTNVGDHVQQMDISKMTWEDVPKADVWAFGFPCQDLSVAGKQAGMIKGVTRSGLFFEIMRLLEETRNQKPENLPSIIVAENVKALKRVLPTVKEEYENQGYEMRETLYNSKYWGVPQNRERYFVVGLRKDLNLTFEFLEEQTTYVPKLSSILESEVDEKYYISDEKASKIIEQAKAKTELKNVHACITPDRLEKRQNGRRAKEEEEEAFTCTAQDRHGVLLSKQATVLNKFVEQTGTSMARDYKGFGNQEMTGVLEIANAEERSANKTSQSLQESDGTQKVQQRRTDGPVALQQASLLRSGMCEEVAKDVLEIAKKTRPNEELGVKIQENGNIRPHRMDARKSGLSELNVCYEGNESFTCTASHANKIYGETTNFRVRKLTPREYARLQGFPESFTFVVSNSQLYKQFGNAVTVNVARAIATAFKAVLL